MRYSELKILSEIFDSKREVRTAIESISRCYVTLEEIENDCYFTADGYFWSDYDYVIDHQGNVLHREDAHWCEGLEEYVHRDNIVRVYEGRNETFYSERYASRNYDYTYFDGSYYDDSALDIHGIVLLADIQEWGYADDAYWSESREEWTSTKREEYVRGYHNGSYKSLIFDDKSKFSIGYEIEKEDETVRNSIDIDYFEEETNHLWRKEHDGSLDSDRGYELISPTFELNIDKIFEHIEGNPYLVSHINAEHSYSCGGHIHLSEKGLNGDELFNKIKGYTPLFYALYYGRVNKSYCKGKKNDDLQNENEKYQAIKIHDDRVEFRIISAVPNVETLKWRTKLLMMILQHPTNNIIQAYYNVDTKFTKLLKQVYSDEKLVEVKQRFIKFTREFEQLEIKNNNNN
jgi:hypothetical protein